MPSRLSCTTFASMGGLESLYVMHGSKCLHDPSPLAAVGSEKKYSKKKSFQSTSTVFYLGSNV